MGTWASTGKIVNVRRMKNNIRNHLETIESVSLTLK
jgi:hypothetical protein